MYVYAYMALVRMVEDAYSQKATHRDWEAKNS